MNAQHESDERLRLLFDQSPLAIFQFDADARVTACNDGFLEMFQATREAVIGRDLPVLRDPRIASVLRAAAAGRESRHEGPCDPGSGGERFLAIKALPLGPAAGGIGFVQDLTETRRIEQALEQRVLTLQAIHEVTADLGSELKLRPVLRRIMDRAVLLLDARRGGGIYLYDPTENVLRLTEVAGINEGRVGAVVQLHEGMSGHVFRTGKPLIVNDYANWPERLIVLVQSPSSSVMGVPLRWAGKIIGVLGVFDDSCRRTFDQADVELLEVFADQAAIAIHNAQLYEQTQQEITAPPAGDLIGTARIRNQRSTPGPWHGYSSTNCRVRPARTVWIPSSAARAMRSPPSPALRATSR